MSEKPFDATPSRLQRAKREGDRPRSQDLCAVSAFGGGALAVIAGGGPAFGAMHVALAAAAASAASLRDGLPVAADQPWGAYATIAMYALSVPFFAFACAAIANTVQTGAFTFAIPPPKFEKLNPFAGMKRLFGGDALLSGCKAFACALAIGFALGPALRDAIASAASTATPASLAARASGTLEIVVATALIVALGFGLGDVLTERTKWRRRLKMSFDELKRDQKESEGDPQLRGRRRAAHRSLVRGSPARVREAAFVIVNPVHVAIALEYRPPEVPVPRVLVRAVDAGALAVKSLAREANVPIVEDVPLARALLATTDVGDFIPAQTYGAVALIVASLVRSGALARSAA